MSDQEGHDPDAIVYYYDPVELEGPYAPLPMPKAGDRFQLGDFEVVVTAVYPADKVEAPHFTIQMSTPEESDDQPQRRADDAGGDLHGQGQDGPDPDLLP
ncbi:MAG: hypothetical protein ACJ780_31530 [Solirubrobacteraceae bacterium]